MNNTHLSILDKRDDKFLGPFPPGDYKLLIKAIGYQPVEKYYSVVPGIPKRFRVTELTPD
jgi:hypothetical protein